MLPGGMAVLIIEDDRILRETIRMLCEHLEKMCHVVENIPLAIEYLKSNDPEQIIVDLSLTNDSIEGLMNYIEMKKKVIPRLIVISGLINAEKLLLPYKNIYFLKKPFVLENIIKLLQM